MTTSRCPIVDWNTFGGRGKLDASMPSLPTTGLQIKSSAERQLAFGELALSLHASTATNGVEG